MLAMLSIVVVLIVAGYVWRFGRSQTILDRWAEANGLRILNKEYRWMMRGPFAWTTSKGQAVYRVTVEDAAGRTRSGWVRCGSWLAGLLSDRVDVRWDAADRPGFPVVFPNQH